jgi:predicted DNA-binding transcriptional regulator AlpA
MTAAGQDRPRAVIMIKEVLRDYARCSRASLYRWIDSGLFPQPRRIGPKRIGFIRAECDEWLATREVSHRRRSRRREVV